MDPALTQAVNDLTALLASVFSVPDGVVLAQVWALGFSTPMAAGLAAYAVKSILHMFDRRGH
ncbi:MAG: hypothetical protein EG826_15585 [Deltaproteobacteria bacterium]|nr:hypothetical protein [Deltaproteobacteria bacterium]